MPSSAFALILAIDPTTPSSLYVGTSSNGAFKSTDGAMSWQPVTGDLPTTVQALVTNGGMPNMLLAGALNCEGTGNCRGGMFESTDGGSNWRAVNPDLTISIAAHAVDPAGPSALTVAIDPRTPTTLYAGTSDLGAGGAVFKSTDTGTSWHNVDAGFLGNASVEVLGVDPTPPGTLYAGATNGVFISTDGASSWPPSNRGLPDHTWVHALAIDTRAPTTVYVGAERDNVPRSLQEHQSWSQLEPPDSARAGGHRGARH